MTPVAYLREFSSMCVCDIKAHAEDEVTGGHRHLEDYYQIRAAVADCSSGVKFSTSCRSSRGHPHPHHHHKLAASIAEWFAPLFYVQKVPKFKFSATE